MGCNPRGSGVRVVVNQGAVVVFVSGVNVTVVAAVAGVLSVLTICVMLVELVQDLRRGSCGGLKRDPSPSHNDIGSSQIP